PGSLQELISQTMVHWAQEAFIESPELVRAMFNLLHRQYDGLGELVRALPKAYTISAVSVDDTMSLLECLGQIRSLLIVQMGPEEENLMIQSIGCGEPLSLASCIPPGNPASFLGLLHPPLGILHPPWASCIPPGPPASLLGLLHPSRTSCIPPSRHPAPPCVSCILPAPLSASCLPSAPSAPPHPVSPPAPPVVTYLASCGLQSCPMLLSKGYPDIGWNPCGGERYLDFLRFAVFVNGESVEENANVVVRLLIR
ncbi:RYR3 protein, partial [Crypturellus soui]|nr:RYR3 protein [Crypturellus soui]